LDALQNVNYLKNSQQTPKNAKRFWGVAELTPTRPAVDVRTQPAPFVDI
jgi:hypothetical protein